MAVVGAISQRIWDMKYRLRGPANGDMPGEPLDKTIEDTWRRVATALAAPERERAQWAERFYRAMEDFKFLPAGRVVAGAGSSRSVTLFNCFVMGAIPDDMGGIFAHLREAALTMQQGGGIGYDFSTLRPRGAPVKGVGAARAGHDGDAAVVLGRGADHRRAADVDLLDDLGRGRAGRAPSARTGRGWRPGAGTARCRARELASWPGWPDRPAGPRAPAGAAS